MTSFNKKRKRELTPAEQKTTAAFKLMSERVKTLEKSLKNTQNELESYRTKYYDADKKHAIQMSKNNTLVFHEILKFVVSILCGGIGVNLITDGKIVEGIRIIVLGVVLYGIIVITDKYKKHEKT